MADKENKGTIESITGVVIDAAFPEELPEIYSALHVSVPEGEGRQAHDLTCEVQQHLGDDRVRAVAMDATDGLRRGDEITDTGGAVTGPGREEETGGVFKLLGGAVG